MTVGRQTIAPGDGDRLETSANRILIAAALGLFAIRFYIAASTGLVDDEAYYRIWSLAPALSYYDHPPMVAWMIAAGRAIAGDTTLGVRLLAPLVHLVGAFLLWRTALLLYGAEIARRAVCFMLAMPLLAVGGVIVTPDLPSVLSAGLVLWAVAELDRSKNANWWLAIGVFAGIGLLSKYTNLFIGATILIWILAGRGNSRWLLSPQLWIGGLIAAALTSPVVIWNSRHDWVSFAKQFGRVGHKGSLGAHYLLEFVGSFVGLASPVIAGLATVGLVLITRSAIQNRKSSDVLIAAAVLPMTFYFLIHTLHDRVQGNWMAPLYPALAICAAVALGTIGERLRPAVFAGSLALGLAMTGIIYAHALHPLPVSFVRKDPTEQMRGWAELGDLVEKKRREAGAAWVATSSYATTGQLAFALKGRAEVLQLNERIRYIFLPTPPPELTKQPALYVELQRRANPELLKSKFRSVTPLGTLKRENGSADGAVYELFLVSDAAEPPI